MECTFNCENYWIGGEIQEYCFNCMKRDIKLFDQEQLNDFLNDYNFFNVKSRTVLKFLLENGANPNIPCNHYDREIYIIHDICFRGYWKELNLLLKVSDINVNVKDAIDRKTPLELVCISRRGMENDLLECARLLIESGLVDEETIIKCRIMKGLSNEMLRVLNEWDDYLPFDIKEPCVE